MKYCEEYAALLDLFVDGELSLEEMLEVQAHLDECPACRAYVDDALRGAEESMAQALDTVRQSRARYQSAAGQVQKQPEDHFE